MLFLYHPPMDWSPDLYVHVEPRFPPTHFVHLAYLNYYYYGEFSEGRSYGEERLSTQSGSSMGDSGTRKTSLAIRILLDITEELCQ